MENSLGRIDSTCMSFTEMKIVRFPINQLLIYFIKGNFNLEIVHKIRLLDPGFDTDLIFALYYRIGDNSIRLKMIRKSTATIEDRDRLIVDRNDGTSFADFECEY
jgi:hypothetical protein